MFSITQHRPRGAVVQRQTSPESQGLPVNSVHCGSSMALPPVMTEAEVGVIWPQVQEHWGPPEAGGGKGKFSPTGLGGSTVL